MSRTQQISREIVERLSEWDGPAAEAVVFAATALRFPGGLLVSEFDEAMKFLEEKRYVTGVRDDFNGRMWSLTNKGRAARHA
jgi:hypothetical protein